MPMPKCSLASNVMVSIPDRRIAEALYAKLVTLEVKTLCLESQVVLYRYYSFRSGSISRSVTAINSAVSARQ